MKNDNGKFFFIGILIGGTILFSAVNFQRFIAISDPNQKNTYTLTPSDNLPRLLALEPTKVIEQATQQVITATAEIESTTTPAKATFTSTATPLYLANEQEPEIIGNSVNGLPLEVYTFGSGEHKRMIVAGIHGGDEWNTVTLANQLITYIAQYPDIVPDDVKLYVLRNLNPDGEARAHNKNGRLNSNGVDLNRNFPANWQADWNRAGCWNYLPSSSGSEAGSEPETRALMGFIESHNIEALISYHSAALGIFPGGEPWDENSIRFAESIAEVSSYPFPPIDTSCSYTGTLADYAVAKRIVAVDLELTNHIDTDFDTNLNILEILLTFQP